MPFKDFTVGEVLSSADVDLYLMSQAVIRCTSGTRPTPVQGTHIYETDTNRTMRYTGSVWEEVGLRPLAALKTSSEGTTSTADHSDAALVLPVAANTNYYVECFLITDGTSAATWINIGWQVPSGTTFSWMSGHLVDDGGGVGSGTEGLANFSVFSASGRANSLLAGAGNDVVVPIRGTLRVGANAGNLQLRWNPVFSTGTPTYVKAGSLLMATKLS